MKFLRFVRCRQPNRLTIFWRQHRSRRRRWRRRQCRRATYFWSSLPIHFCVPILSSVRVYAHSIHAEIHSSLRVRCEQFEHNFVSRDDACWGRAHIHSTLFCKIYLHLTCLSTNWWRLMWQLLRFELQHSHHYNQTTAPYATNVYLCTRIYTHSVHSHTFGAYDELFCKYIISAAMNEIFFHTEHPTHIHTHTPIHATFHRLTKHSRLKIVLVDGELWYVGAHKYRHYRMTEYEMQHPTTELVLWKRTNEL